MSIYEYNQEKHLRQEREASWEEGRESGISESRRQTAINLSKMGMDVERLPRRWKQVWKKCRRGLRMKM